MRILYYYYGVPKIYGVSRNTNNNINASRKHEGAMIRACCVNVKMQTVSQQKGPSVLRWGFKSVCEMDLKCSIVEPDVRSGLWQMSVWVWSKYNGRPASKIANVELNLNTRAQTFPPMPF